MSRSKEVENVDLNVKELISDRDEEIYQQALHELQQQAKK